MSSDADFNPDDLPDLEDQPPCNDWIVNVIVGIETPEGEAAEGLIKDLEFQFDHNPSQQEVWEQILDETAPWLATFSGSKPFAERFGNNPTITLLGVTYQQGC